MKWYFACNQQSKEYEPLIKAAVCSAIKNTTLSPHFVYDGTPDELTMWLEEKGVKVIYHRSNLYPILQKKYKENELKISSGAYLRCDIPIIEQEEDFVLYTDCDVIFLKDIVAESLSKPDYFCCAPEVDIENTKIFNTGVMFMNVNNLRKTYKSFCGFIKHNLWRLVTWDQTAYQLYYGEKSSPLDLQYNHKIYWGVNENASIIHYHGAKPTMFADEESIKNLDYFNGLLYRKNPESCEYYLNLFKEYYPEITYNQEGINKLKQGIYPVTKPPKNPLKIRIKNFIRKHLINWF
ncbi:hypothetical protein IJ818_01760 [bacterium]|nr:hypothetical protein [bacterium]